MILDDDYYSMCIEIVLFLVIVILDRLCWIVLCVLFHNNQNISILLLKSADQLWSMNFSSFIFQFTINVLFETMILIGWTIYLTGLSTNLGWISQFDILAYYFKGDTVWL